MDRLLIVVLVVAITASAASAASVPATFRGPASVQYMDINPFDGRYVFGYTTVDSARQERRNLDGTVEGNYSYINPDGKLIQVNYEADSHGFKASGDHLPPADTPAVQKAKDAHFSAYAKELARITAGNHASTKEYELKSGTHPTALLKAGVAVENDNTDDSEVVVAAPEEPITENVFTPSSYPLKNKENEISVYPSRHNMIVDNPIYYLAIPLFRHSTNIFIPISIHNFGRVAAVHDAQVPNYAQRNLFYSSQVHENKMIA